ncbi:MAG TPA: NUDIX domain-containing protein [Caulobacteraceae bacterium]|jgi:8-oxo-dGTP pyrophosphatase MutT (NUDIX family)
MPTSEVPLVHRQAVRALILTADHEVLLCRIHTPVGGPSFWIAPGGGLEPGETVDEGLRRELLEELGLTEFEAGPVIWRRHHTFDWGDRRISQKEEYRVVHVDRFDPVMSDLVEAEVLECFRWWPIAELATSTEQLTPLSLADILLRYLRDGAPATPPDEEVLVD